MTSEQTVRDQELAQFGWMESVATNSISNFKTPSTNFEAQQTNKIKTDLIDKFICHLIFYVIFCCSLFLYVVIDLGLGSFLKNKLNHSIKIINQTEKPLLIATLSN